MAGMIDEKFRKMQDEMSRFEEEIGLPLPDIVPLPPDKGADSFMPAPPAPPGSLLAPLPAIPPPPPPSGLVPSGGLPPAPPGSVPPGPIPHGVLPHGPPLPPGVLPPASVGHHGPPIPGMMPPGMVPPNIPQGLMPPPAPPMMPGPPMFSGPPHIMPQHMQPAPPLPMPPQFPPQFQNNVPQPRPEKKPGPVVLSSTPMLYHATPQIDTSIDQSLELAVLRPVESGVTSTAIEKKKKIEKPVITVTTEPVTIQNKSSKKEKKNRKLMRTAGGHTWEDSTLGEWDDDDFRLFCGDLGNDVTDEVLSRAFSKYASFMKAKVIRDKRTNKTKGFGFVSFKDPQDFIKATKEMNGRYVGSRPIKLRKSTWKNRALDVVRKKDKEKVALINMLTGK